MNKAMLAVLNESERQLVLQTEKPALAALDEDGLVALMGRLRRARNKASGQYRRGAAAKVAAKGARGPVSQGNTGARAKVEVLEEALTRVSTALAAQSRKNAAALKAERLAAARGESTTQRPATTSTPAARKKAAPRTAPKRTRSDSAVVSKKNASTLAAGARRQAKRDSR